MRLTQDEVTRILNKFIAEWRGHELVKTSVDDARLRTHLNDAFMKELKLEDDLNADVDTMLKQYEKQFERGELDRRKMHQMVKNQLAKERKIVL